MVDSHLNEVLLTVLQPQYHSHAGEWLQAASLSEKKGVKMLGAIQRHKGTKKFRPQETAAVAVVEEVKKRVARSTYAQEFSQERQRPRSAVLARNRFAELPCSQVLSAVTKRFVEAWMRVETEDSYIETVLETLRSLFAFFTSAKRATTESRRSFMWCDPTKLFTAHRLDHLNNKSQASRASSAGKPWVAPKPVEKVDTTMQANIFTPEDLKRRRDALTKGSGQVATWIVGPTEILSSYQQTYVTHFNKYKGVSTREKEASLAAGRMVPNPDIENQ